MTGRNSSRSAVTLRIIDVVGPCPAECQHSPIVRLAPVPPRRGKFITYEAGRYVIHEVSGGRVYRYATATTLITAVFHARK